MLWRRKPWGVLIAGLSTVAILVPATIDFGASTFNSNSPRFLLVGGAGAAMLFGVMLGEAWEVANRSGSARRVMATIAVAGVAAFAFWPSARVAFNTIRAAAKYPREHYLVAEEWACARVQPRQPCDPIDVSAATSLRPFLSGTDRVLVDFRGDKLVNVMSSQGLFVTFARAPLAGAAFKGVLQDNNSQFTELWDSAGFRARLFLGTGLVSPLDDLGVSYVYLDPANLLPKVYQKIEKEPRLQRVLRVQGPDGVVREAYRVRPAPTGTEWLAPERFRLLSAEPPSQLGAHGVYPVTLLLSGPSGAAEGELRLSYEVCFPDGHLVTRNDEVRLPVQLRLVEPRTWTGTLWLATPLKPGLYEIRLYGWDGNSRSPLLDERQRPAVLKVNVRES